jgi:hypothetical protein
MPWVVFEQRWAEMWHSAAFFVPEAKVAEVLAATGWTKTGIARSTNGLRAFLRSRFYLRGGDWNEALRWGRHAQRQLSGETFPALYNDILVRRLYEEARFDDSPSAPGSAGDAWKRAVQRGLAERGSVSAGTQRIEKALQHERLGFFLSCHLLSLADWAAARGDPWARRIQLPLCQSLCRQAPINRYYRVRLVETNAQDGDWEAAARNLMVLTDLYPGDEQARLALGESLCAVDRAGEAVALMGGVGWMARLTEPGYRYLAGHRARLAGNRVRARDEFAEAMRRDPLEPRYALALAEAQHDLARDEQARRELLWIQRVDPGGSVAREAAQKEARWWPR